MPAISGIDWADEWNDVRIADRDSGELLEERRFAADEQGISDLIAVLLEHEVEDAAIERPDGLLVGRLLAAGVRVLAIHPNQVKAARDRFRAAAGKSDRFDAFVLCELARTDRHRFPALASCSDETLALRALVRTRENLVELRVGLANQLRAQLQTFWPGAKDIFADIDSPIALAFLARYPSPEDACGLGPKRLAGFLHRHAYCGRRSPEQLLQRLRSAPLAAISELEREARRDAVIALLAVLGPTVEQISQLTSQIAGAVRSHPDGPIFLAFFRDPKSTITAAGLLNGLLPCGLVYMALSASLAVPSSAQAVGLMYIFGLGTVPMMAAITLLKSRMAFLRTNHVRKLVPVIVFAFGCLFVLRGMNLGIPYLSPKVVVAQHEIRSCCHKH